MQDVIKAREQAIKDMMNTIDDPDRTDKQWDKIEKLGEMYEELREEVKAYNKEHQQPASDTA